jgi:hypothetical protein
MPISLLKDIVVEHIDAIHFKRPTSHFSPSVMGCVKNVILNGNGVDVTVLDKSSFRVSLQAERYYESLASDFYYSLQKVTRQREALELMLGNQCPSAWLLVTAYYHAFYAAVQVSRLTGYYNMSIDSSQVDRINDLNESHERLASPSAYLGSGVFLDTNSDSIKIVFKKNGTKPHQLAWSNISRCLTDVAVSKQAEGRRL